jgi:YHYH protein
MYKLLITLTIILFGNIGCNSPQKTSSNTEASIPKVKNENDFLGSYTINDKVYGTKTVVTITGDKRVMTTNGLPNHTTGTFPNAGNPNTISAQNVKYLFPLKPVYRGKAKWAREPGVAVNGVKFEPETAEAFVCETGERYRIEAFQTLVNLGLDSNHAHVQPTGAYHYHAAPTGLINLLDKGEDLILVGFALDGFPIYYSKSGKYKPSFKLASKSRTGDVCSYDTRKEIIKKELKNTNPDGTFVSDWEYVKGLGDLDECNGINLHGKYMYFVTDTYPYLGRCLMGEYTEQRPKGPPPGGGQRPPQGGGQRPPGGPTSSEEHPHPHNH